MPTGVGLGVSAKGKHMKHIIADKLNFLMKVTGTKNNMLGRALSFDASHISRIRSGQRGLPSHREFIVPAAGYFARAVTTATQRNVLARRICPGRKWPDTAEGATLLIAEWLSEDVQTLDYASLHRFLEENDAMAGEVTADLPAAGAATKFYMGNEGKCQCVIRFLTDLAARQEPVTLLLHSEENMAWIYEKPEFARQWGQLLVTLLQQGGRIVIVHTLSRSFEEMLEAVTKWAPLYATGSIEPYYYPKLRDNLFRRTLFIARDIAAITACTTGDPGENRLNMLTRDAAAVKALEQEFHDFLSLCRPLMQIFTSDNFIKLIPRSWVPSARPRASWCSSILRRPLSPCRTKWRRVSPTVPAVKVLPISLRTISDGCLSREKRPPMRLRIFCACRASTP